jgi:hypothetical protein
MPSFKIVFDRILDREGDAAMRSRYSLKREQGRCRFSLTRRAAEKDEARTLA